MNKTPLIVVAVVLAAVLLALVFFGFIFPTLQGNGQEATKPFVTDATTEPTEDAAAATEETQGITTPDEPIELDDPTQAPESVAVSDPTKATAKPTDPSTKPSTQQPTQGEQVYTITYTGLSGTTHKNPATYTAKTAADITLQKPSARKGYDFDGWYLDGKKIDSLAGQTGNLTLEARWSKKTDNGDPIELPNVPF